MLIGKPMCLDLCMIHIPKHSHKWERYTLFSEIFNPALLNSLSSPNNHWDVWYKQCKELWVSFFISCGWNILNYTFVHKFEPKFLQVSWLFERIIEARGKGLSGSCIYISSPTTKTNYSPKQNSGTLLSPISMWQQVAE